MSIMLWVLLTTLVCFLSFQALRDKKRECAHEVLVNRVKRFRLYKMLLFIGADQDEYLRTVSISDINQQIDRCSSCSAIDTCDSYLRDGKKVDSMSFCPNHKSFSEYSKTIHLHRMH